MALTKRAIEKKIEKFFVEKDGYTFLKKECVKEAEDTIFSEFENVYVNIQDSDVGRSRFMVGNIGKRLSRPVYEIYID